MIATPDKTRDEWRSVWLQFYRNYYTEADGTPIPVDVGPGSYPWIRASVIAGVLAMQSATAKAIANAQLLDSLSGTDLDTKYGSRIPRVSSTKASGYQVMECGSAGTPIQSGDELVCGATGLLYRFSGTTTAYTNGQIVPVESVDFGLGQNLAPGSVLTWVTPRAGCYATCLTWEASPGRGIWGGRESESDESYRERIRAFQANPAGNMNEGALIALLEESSPNEALGRPGHGVPVEKGFAYPAIRGAGTCGLAFTVLADNDFETRYPSSGQLSTVFGYVSQYAHARDMLFMAAMLGHSTRIDVLVTLADAAVQWANYTPWPAWRERDNGMLVISTSPGALSFAIAADNSDYVGVAQPVAGTVVGVFDSSTGSFKRKRIATVTGTGPWTVTIDPSPVYSDATFVPVEGKCVVPWFDSINEVAASVLRTMATHGPGEMTAHDPQDGKRMKRVPTPTPRSWPKVISPYVVGNIPDDVTSVDAAAYPVGTFSSGATVTTPSVGSTAVVYMLEMTDLGVFKQ